EAPHQIRDLAGGRRATAKPAMGRMIGQCHCRDRPDLMAETLQCENSTAIADMAKRHPGMDRQDVHRSPCSRDRGAAASDLSARDAGCRMAAITQGGLMPEVIRPRRSALYVPGANTRALEKARTLDADVLIFDLEDAVADSQKEASRGNVL